MLRLIEVSTGEVIKTYPEGFEGWVELPNGDRVSPALDGWESDGFRIEAFTPPPPPDPEPETRWQVSTYRIVRRIADAGKAAAGKALLQADPAMELRFLTVGHVWNDDIPLNAALPQIGLDPAVILAPED